MDGMMQGPPVSDDHAHYGIHRESASCHVDPVCTPVKEEAMQSVDGRVDMLKVREYDGAKWLSLEPASGGFIGIARFPNAFTEEMFWDWHESRMEGILEEVLAAIAPHITSRPTLEKLQKIITGRIDSQNGE